MFGIKRMKRQRNRLYERTQRLEKQATVARQKVKDSALETATSPAGLIASFVLGATTQCDISKKARQNLLNGATKDVLSFLSAQVMAYMAVDSQKTPTPEESVPEEEKTPSQSEIFSQNSPANTSTSPSTNA